MPPDGVRALLPLPRGPLRRPAGDLPGGRRRLGRRAAGGGRRRGGGAWDAYGQPTGIHYRPHADNRAHQDAPWLDFQWCQTGHSGEHVPERVADMWRNTPAKGVPNGEPTYEHTRERGRGAGWWQGHEAWSNLCAGGTMGVVYGAASLWQWRLHADEPGHARYFLAAGAGWREALDFEGSRTSAWSAASWTACRSPTWRPTGRSLGGAACCVPGELVLVYREGGRMVMLTDPGLPPHLTVIDPRTGETVEQTLLDPVPQFLQNECGEPRLYVFTRQPIERT